MNIRSGLRFSLASLACIPVFVPGAAHALAITATQDTNALIGALLAGGDTGIVVTGVTLNGHEQTVDLFGVTSGTLTSSGTYTNASGTYGIGSGVVLSTGGVQGMSYLGTSIFAGYGDGPNESESNGWYYGGTFPPQPPDPKNPDLNPPGVPATSAQEALLDPITARPDLDPPETYDHFDVTELVISFDMQPGFDQVVFNVVFGSEEFPEYVESEYIDGFGMFLNGANIASAGGQPVNIRHPDMAAIAGTELDGVLAPGGNPLLTFGGPANPTGNTLRFIVADTSDGIYDTTVYFSGLGGVEIPAPPAAWLALTGLAALLPRLRRR
jgi:hypothetical protein